MAVFGTMMRILTSTFECNGARLMFALLGVILN